MVLRRSIRIGRAPFFFDRTACRAAPDVILERTSRTEVEANLGPGDPQLNRWTRPCFSLSPPVRNGPARHVRSARRALQLMHSTPQLVIIWAVSGPFLRAPKSPEFQGRQALHPLPRPAGGVVVLEPIWERPAGPKHTRAEQEES